VDGLNIFRVVSDFLHPLAFALVSGNALQTIVNMATPVGYKIFSRIVHNEAMKKDPPEIYGWRAIALACSVRAVDASLQRRTDS
jgi:hypothetical protein